MIIQKILNKLGYYKIEQLSVGGTCGCCGKKISNMIYYQDDWGICNKCNKCN